MVVLLLFRLTTHLTIATAVLAATNTTWKLQALFARGVHAVILPRVLPQAAFMHLLCATRPGQVTGTSPELAAACRSLGVFVAPEGRLVSPEMAGPCKGGSISLPLEPEGQAPYRHVRISSKLLHKQMLASREIFETSDSLSAKFVILASDAGTSWVVDALALNCPVLDPKSPSLADQILQLNHEHLTLLFDAVGLRDFHQMLSQLDIETCRKVKDSIGRIVVDAPVFALNRQHFLAFVNQNRATWGTRVFYRLCFANTGSVALLNSTFTEIISKAPGTKLRIGDGSRKQSNCLYPGVVCAKGGVSDCLHRKK